MDALKAIVGAAQHVLERRIDDAAEGKIPFGQLMVAALVLEGVRVWLRLHGAAEEADKAEPMKLRGEVEAPSCSCAHYGDDQYGPN